MKHWDSIEQHCIFDHGWQIDYDNNEMLVLTKRQFNAYQYAGHSYRDPTVRTLMLPSVHGCCLIFEGKHFRIEG
jgi:hypothetical protein